MFGCNEINLFASTTCNWCYFIVRSMQSTWRLEKKAKNSYCISTVIATNCTSTYKSYRMYHLHSLKWQWLIILRLYSYLPALEFWHSYCLAFGPACKPPGSWCLFLMSLQKCDTIIPYHTVCFFPVFFFFCFAFMACKQINFVLKVEQPWFCRKKYRQQKH